MFENKPFVPVYRPWIGEREAEAARRPILSGWVTMAPEVRQMTEPDQDYVVARLESVLVAAPAA
jgi:perosamine synthetase